MNKKKKLFSAIVLATGLFIVLSGSMIDTSKYDGNDVHKDRTDYIAAKTCNVYASNGYADSKQYKEKEIDKQICGGTISDKEPGTSTYCYMKEGPLSDRHW